MNNKHIKYLISGSLGGSAKVRKTALDFFKYLI